MFKFSIFSIPATIYIFYFIYIIKVNIIFWKKLLIFNLKSNAEVDFFVFFIESENDSPNLRFYVV